MALDLVVLLNVRTCLTSLELAEFLGQFTISSPRYQRDESEEKMTETRISLFANCGGISCIVQMLPLPDNDQNTLYLSSL